ncbi:gamma carbonic anhydrase family protein [Clostridium tunisiense]|uniref:gamma carbonic anhydrase family protein n=1 Tax=Clostridium tunisiense TaxID=219748 RepID=UPI0002F6C19B|nr:gamma carbonic anhydrase family protein [Clostridium tunisiense]
MIKSYKGKMPSIKESCFVAENATVIGQVSIDDNANIWYGTVIRSDMDYTTIGKNTNIQENTTVHNDFNTPTEIGDNVTIGHNCVIHGCKINNNVLIGMGSIILNNAEIGENTIIGAGSLVTQGKKIPSGVLCIGSPAKVVRELSSEEIASIKSSAIHYLEMAEEHKKL